MMCLTDTLLRLVQVATVTGNEKLLADEIAHRLGVLVDSASGRAPVRRDLVLRRHSDSLVLGPRDPGASGRPLVVLAGHLDTVPLGGAWPPRLEGDVLHGRGAVDMKAGVAVMLHLAEELDPGLGFAERAFVFYTGEEGPADGNSLGPVLAAEPWLTRAGLAILLEPTAGGLELGCNGSLHCRVVFTGRACHSARPWTGLHPFAAALPWLAEVQRLPERRVELAGVTFREIAVVTQIRAGEVRNVVPGTVEVNLNLRYAPDRTKEDAERFARSLCPIPRPLSPGDGAESVGVNVEIVDHAGPGTVDESAPLFRHLLEATGLPRAAKQGWTDVARFGAWGVPAVNWGAGDPLLCHRDDEHVSLPEVQALFDRMARFLSGPGPRTVA